MAHELTPATQLLYSTVKLTTTKNQRVHGTGTGFFMNFMIDEKSQVPVIVTNKHVVKDCDSVIAMCHIGNSGKPSGEFAACEIRIHSEGIFNHPDPEIDLCAIPFANIIEKAREDGEEIFYIFLNLDSIPAEDDWKYFDALEEVLMVGCPNGISDEKNNLPLARRGITASAMSKNYNGRSEFVIDMACFPGSSGSPIFLYDRSGYYDGKTRTYHMGKQRLHLVGILYAGPQITNSGKVILTQPSSVSVASMMHLGFAIKATELKAIETVVRNRITTNLG